MTRTLAVMLTLLLAGCGGESPTDPLASLQRGRLSGIVTIGPNCPASTPGAPCPTPPSAYSARKVLVFDESRTTLLHTVDIDSRGAYLIDLTPRTYTIDVRKLSGDSVRGLPAKVEIVKNSVTSLDIEIDTGIR